MTFPTTGVFFTSEGGDPIPCEYWAPFRIPFERGTRPSMFSVVSANPKWADIENPITITVVTPNAPMRGPAELKLENWSVIASKAVAHPPARKPSAGDGDGGGGEQAQNPPLMRYELADCRWAARYKTFTKLEGFNIRSYGGEYRVGSLSGNARWTYRDALTEILRQFDLDVVFSDNVNVDEFVPDNLANALGGGWFGSPIDEVVPPLLEFINADLAPTFDGRVAVVDRSEPVQWVSGVKDTLIQGQLETRDISWSAPERVRVQFRVRVEQRWEIVDRSRASGEVNSTEIENVAPAINTADIDSLAQRIFTWRSFDSFVESELSAYGLYDDLAKFFFARSLIPGTVKHRENITDEAFQRHVTADNLARTFWRRAYRVKDDSEAAKLARQAFADIKLGAMKEDGTTAIEGGVLADHAIQQRFGRYTGRDTSYEAQFSENVPFGPAPFKAQWIDRDQLVFEVVRNELPPSLTGAWIGHLAGHGIAFNQRDANQLAKGEDWTLRSDVEFQPGYNLDVYWHGLLLRKVGSINPVYELTRDLSFEGESQIEEVMVRADGITANFFAEDAASGGGIEGLYLANEAELIKRADFIKAELEESYRQRRTGVLTLDGVGEIVRQELPVEGDIMAMEIRVGTQQTWDVQTVIVVQPAVAPARSAPIDIQTPEKFL